MLVWWHFPLDLCTDDDDAFFPQANGWLSVVHVVDMPWQRESSPRAWLCHRGRMDQRRQTSRQKISRQPLAACLHSFCSVPNIITLRGTCCLQLGTARNKIWKQFVYSALDGRQTLRRRGAKVQRVWERKARIGLQRPHASLTSSLETFPFIRLHW